MNEQQLAEIEARAAKLPWNTGIGCTLEGITYYAHDRSDDEDQALIETLERLKPDLTDLVAEIRRLRAALASEQPERCNYRTHGTDAGCATCGIPPIRPGARSL